MLLETTLDLREPPIGGGGGSSLDEFVVCLAVSKDHVLSGGIEESEGSKGGGDFLNEPKGREVL
jgi:hypothetical protein